jgi:hypothetical protein
VASQTGGKQAGNRPETNPTASESAQLAAQEGPGGENQPRNEPKLGGDDEIPEKSLRIVSSGTSDFWRDASFLKTLFAPGHRSGIVGVFAWKSGVKVLGRVFKPGYRRSV